MKKLINILDEITIRGGGSPNKNIKTFIEYNKNIIQKILEDNDDLGNFSFKEPHKTFPGGEDNDYPTIGYYNPNTEYNEEDDEYPCHGIIFTTDPEEMEGDGPVNGGVFFKIGPYNLQYQTFAC